MSFKVGDIVYCKDFGEGVVTNVIKDGSTSHPVVVKFKIDGMPTRFKSDGKFWLQLPDRDADINLKKSKIDLK